MTRFLKELNGDYGEYWQNNARKELESVRNELLNGEITIDENGVGRNCIGRVLASDMVEKVALLTDKINPEATDRALMRDITKLAESVRNRVRSAEELFEMRAVFGEGAEVVNVLTGERTRL